MKDLFLNYWTLLTDKAFELSTYYGVDPIMFGLLYAGTIPLLWLSIGWIIRNINKKLSVTIPLVITVLCYSGTYIYLLIAGQNIPFWVYGIAVVMTGYSGYGICKKISGKANETGMKKELNSGNSEYINT
ncbi:MAG: hypothetical protein ACNA8K_08865 [Cyclonatronaceae bacterium]